MAALDKLLLTMAGHEADSLILRPGRRPSMQRSGGGERELTKAPLDGAVIARLLTEVASSAEPAAEDGDRWDFDYTLDERVFRFAGLRGPQGWTVSVTSKVEVVDIPDVPTLLAETVRRSASDLHLSSTQPPWFRVDGELTVSASYRTPGNDRLERMLLEIAPKMNREEFGATGDTDFGYELAGKGRFRVNFFREMGGIAASFRLIPQTIPDIADLGLPEIAKRIAAMSKGLVLVVGPTGSGKSTTLASLIDQINRTRREHIITIEDPVEFVHPSKRSLVHQRQVGLHTHGFVSALRAALREDPDVVMVGELRDLETTSIAIKTAETGHLVFGTLHTTSAAGTIERIIDQFPADQQPQIRLMLAASLRAVLCQVLLKRVGGGRVAAFESLLVTPAISNMIREGKVFQIASAMQTGRRQGMALLDEALLALAEKKIVDPEEAYRKSNQKDDFANRGRAAGIDLSFLGTDAPAEPEAGDA
jgi:twitching motility protein PilT